MFSFFFFLFTHPHTKWEFPTACLVPVWTELVPKTLDALHSLVVPGRLSKQTLLCECVFSVTVSAKTHIHVDISVHIQCPSLPIHSSMP